MSEMRTSAESADALPATTDQAYNNLSDSIKPLIATGFNAPSADTSLQAEGQAAANTFLMGLQTASDSAQHAQIPDSSERTLDSNQELQVSREAQGSIPQIPALHPERSSVNGSESNLEKRYSSGTEYSMSKLPESSAALSGLAPGARPPVAPTPARSTPASSPRARTVSASGTNFKALQQYVADLESEKFELQRGLQRQMELVRKLADDHQDAENHLAACKAEAAELREELQKANASLMDKVLYYHHLLLLLNRCFWNRFEAWTTCSMLWMLFCHPCCGCCSVWLSPVPFVYHFIIAWYAIHKDHIVIFAGTSSEDHRPHAGTDGSRCTTNG